MNTGKIVRLVALLIALIAAFVTLPEEAAILALAGVNGGYFLEGEFAARLLIPALALVVVHGVLHAVLGNRQKLSKSPRLFTTLFNLSAFPS